MTEEDFVKKWRYELTGMAVYGHIGANDAPGLKRAARIFDVPTEVEKLLRQMYAEMKKALTPPPPAPVIPPPKPEPPKQQPTQLKPPPRPNPASGPGR